MTDVYDASNRDHVKAAAKAEKLADRQRREVVVGIMSTTPGRAWMLDLLEVCHVYQSSFQSNALGMAFTEGERNIGLRLLHQITESCPEQYPVMMEERNARSRAADARRSANRATEDGDPGNADDSGAGEES